MQFFEFKSWDLVSVFWYASWSSALGRPQLICAISAGPARLPMCLITRPLLIPILYITAVLDSSTTKTAHDSHYSLVDKGDTALPIDHVRAKAWSSKNPGKVATASSFAIVHGKKWGQKYRAFYYENLPWAAQLAMEQICYVLLPSNLFYGSNILPFSEIPS